MKYLLLKWQRNEHLVVVKSHKDGAYFFLVDPVDVLLDMKQLRVGFAAPHWFLVGRVLLLIGERQRLAR